MDWGSIVLVVEILLLVAGWLLFQQAKSDLTARAAESPVLSEIKQLEKSVAALIEQIRLESTQASAQLGARCLEARDLLFALDARLEDLHQLGARKKGPRRGASRSAESGSDTTDGGKAAARYGDVYALADSGMAPAAIARSSGLSEGEVELILGLRQKA